MNMKESVFSVYIKCWCLKLDLNQHLKTSVTNRKSGAEINIPVYGSFKIT